MPNLANPTVFVDVTRRTLPWLGAATAALFVVGLTLSFMAPPDYQQGETAKIMYLHVPAAWMSTFVYGVMALAALGTLVWAQASPSSASPPARCGASRCGEPIGFGTRA
jgi:heme exporter protein C